MQTQNHIKNCDNAGRLLLVDAMGLAYRSFFAVQGLSASDGTPTNAVFGFIKTLFHLEKVWAPTHWMVIFDSGPAAARIALLPEYKAQRPPMPQALRLQLPLIQEFLDRAGVQRASVENTEADDVMASIAERMRRDSPSAEGLLYTSDKDLFQIVDSRVSVILPSSAEKAMGPDEVRAKMGVPPDLIPALLALTGDASDNIPGVPGIGLKTAAKLLAQYGSWDGLWAEVEKIESEKLRAALKENRALVERNLKLTVLNRHVDCAADWQKAARTKPAPENVLPFFERLEFKSFIKTYATGDLL